MENFKRLSIWKRSLNLAAKVYKLTSDFPKKEIYGLTSQMRRSAVSISSNIAEGAGRSSRQDFARFLNISYGSACELETQLIISNKLGYLSEENMADVMTELDEIQKMIFVLELKKRKTN